MVYPLLLLYDLALLFRLSMVFYIYHSMFNIDMISSHTIFAVIEDDPEK